MQRLALTATLALAAALTPPALAQQASPVPAIQAGNALLTVSADGRSERAPDLALFNAGVTTQGKTAAEALSANSAAMTRVMAAVKRAGVADRDIQTSNLSVNPVYALTSSARARSSAIRSATRYRCGSASWAITAK
jgi:uncharacterized protein